MTVSAEKMVSLTIDGRPVTVPAGTTIFEAARQSGLTIPHYCYDRDLQIVASCRLCFVEIEKVPKLQPSCSTPVNEGMVVYTQNEKVLDARKMQMEFLLVQHPLDCPVCDQGGECKLQEYSLKHGMEDTRFRFQRRTFPKPDIGPFVDLERNRCILCSRCVRYMDEIAGNAEFALTSRGNHTYISTFNDEPLKNEFAGNTIDLCPVGALTSKVTRFRSRVWELRNTPSTCTLCAVGCSINVQCRNRTHEVLRIVPRENEAVNYRWICDIGRFGFDQFNSKQRLQSPYTQAGQNKENISWAKAIGTVVSKLKEVKQQFGPGAIAGLIAPRYSNETLFLFQQFFRENLESNNLDHRTEHIIYSNDDGYLTSIAHGAANEPFKEIKAADAILALASDLPNELPILHLQVRGRAKKVPLYIAHSRRTRLTKDAAGSWVYRPGSELALVIALLKAVVTEKGIPLPGEIASSIQDITPEIAAEKTGLSTSDITSLAKSLASASRPTILLGEAAFAAKDGVEIVRYVSELAQVLKKDRGSSLPLSLLLPYNNSRGAADMALYPHRELGFVRSEKPGRNTTEILQGCIDGSIKALVLFGTDLIEEYPNRPLAQKALETVPFVVFADMLAYETAQFADVVLPLSSYTEEDGTYTNLAGRVQRAERSLPQLEGSLSGYQVLLALGERWGTPWRQIPPTKITDMISRAVPQYAGRTWEGIDALGSDTRPASAAHFSSVLKVKNINPSSLNGSAPEGYPFRLVRGRFLFDEGKEKKFAEPLMERREPLAAELNPNDASQLGVSDGSTVRIAGALGEVKVPVRVEISTPVGSVSLLGHYHGLALNGIVSEDSPWVKVLP